MVIEKEGSRRAVEMAQTLLRALFCSLTFQGIGVSKEGRLREKTACRVAAHIEYLMLPTWATAREAATISEAHKDEPIVTSERSNTAQLSHLASGQRGWGVCSYFKPTLMAHCRET